MRCLSGLNITQHCGWRTQVQVPRLKAKAQKQLARKCLVAVTKLKSTQLVALRACRVYLKGKTARARVRVFVGQAQLEL